MKSRKMFKIIIFLILGLSFGMLNKNLFLGLGIALCFIGAFDTGLKGKKRNQK